MSAGLTGPEPDRPPVGALGGAGVPGEEGLVPATCEEGMVLATYFGERDRTPEGRLLGDELLDLYERAGVRMSVLLRGAEGFGRRHAIRTDRLLTLSEDLPVVSVAVDRRERVEALIEPLLSFKRRGLVTLERARLLGVQGNARSSPRSSGESPASVVPPSAGPLPGEELKLTVYVGRRERVGRRVAFAWVVDLLHRHGVAGATVLLGVDGTRRGHRERARFFGGNARVPVRIVAVGAGGRIAAALTELRAGLTDPLATVERVRVCKRDGRLLAAPHELPGTDEHGLQLWQKLTIYSSQAAMHDGRPLSAQVVRGLRAAGAAGATSVRGIWGFHGEHAPHGDRLLQLRRHVPVLTVAIDAPQRVAQWFEVVDELTREHGLVTSEMVPAAMALGEPGAGGLRLARHDP